MNLQSTDSQSSVVSPLKVSALFFEAGKRSLLHDIYFDLKACETLAVVGHNGAGKTTLFHLILGFKFPDQGEIQIFGRNPKDPLSRQSLAYLPERPYLPMKATLREWVKLQLALHRLPFLEDVFQSHLAQVSLKGVENQPFQNFSKGMLQRSLFLTGMMMNAKLWLMDEPMSGLDPEGREWVRVMLQELKKKEVSILFTSHAMEDVELLSDRVLVLKEGRRQYFGDVKGWVHL